MEDAASEYPARLSDRRSLAESLRAREKLISNARLGVFVLGVVTVLLVWGAAVLPAAAVVPPVIAFLALVVWHDRVIGAREAADRAVAFYERGLARMSGSWQGGGLGGEAYLDPKHPYAADLDLFGPGSLFELLCTARTAAGEQRLADWLRHAAPLEEVRRRQAAVRELCPRLDLREDLALLGEDVRARVHPSLLERWGSQDPVENVGLWRAIAAVLAAASFGTFVAWAQTFFGLPGSGPLPFLVALSLGSLVALYLRARVRRILAMVDAPARDLTLLAQMLERLESERFDSPQLVALRQALETDGAPAWREIARLQRLVVWADARRNQLFAPFAAMLLWGTQFSLAIEMWRRRCGLRLAEWLETVGEIEALTALGSHAFENPDDSFPELVEAGPLFEGEGLGHPLLQSNRCVRNDARLAPESAVLVVSGSNMSGKSTFLRTVGVNAVLGLAGAPVRAQRLRLSRLSLGASIRVTDSLQEGESRFYAEIKRLSQIVGLARGGAPLLFLLDEVLHGTNSHDRQIGAAAVVRGLVEHGAIGLVTTHDLALARIADELAPRAANVHFEDHLEGGRIAFDYHLRPGVVARSNALALMREVGLEV